MSLPNQRKSKSLALKTVNERVDVHDSLDDDAVEKDVAYLAKNFRKFLNSKIAVNLVIKGNSKVQEGIKGNSKRKMEKNPNLHKMSFVLNATGIDTSRKNVRII